MTERKQAAGNRMPAWIDGYGTVRPYDFSRKKTRQEHVPRTQAHGLSVGKDKLVCSLEEVISRIGLRDGMTVSFHHHLRNGDQVVNLVMQAIAAKGLKDIRVAASGLFAVHAPLVKLMEDGVITQIITSTFNSGPVPKAISAGKLQKPCVMMTHGGRPRAILSGDLHIDAAFIAAPACDPQGNLNGTCGKSACGYLSYAYADAACADHVVAVTDNLVPYPACPIEISQEQVEYVVCVPSIGDPGGIVSGTTKITTDPVRLKIADDTVRLMEETGYLCQDMSFQTGASSTALAVADRVRTRMLEKGITGSFALGGIHAYMVKMLEEGLFRTLLDTQCFDLDAVRSAAKNPSHMAISASQYADPDTHTPVVDLLDVVILGATEIDLDFNVNVTTGSNGIIMGASGGHSDCAAGAKLAIVVANLTRKRFCVVRDRVTTITTPGADIDVFVTDHGIAVNPLRTDLLECLEGSSLPIVDMRTLMEIGEGLVGPQAHADVTDRIVGVVEYRDGSVIDLVYQVKETESR